MDSSQEGAFNARKAALSLDLKASDGGPLSISSPAKSPPGSVLPLNPSMEITAAQKQYAQGFFDALRSVHSLHNFEFDNKKTALLSPGYLVPAIVGTTELASPFATTPTSNRELQAILQAMVGTPLGAPPTTTVAGFPNPLTSFIPGPSTTASTTASLASVSNGSSEGSGLKHDIKQELTGSDDSPDTMSEHSRSSSATLNASSSSSALPSSSRSSKLEFEMSLDEQERRKLERKRARNRAAASKCRQKKMDRINELESQVQCEKGRSQMLDSELLRLRAAMAQLENIVQRHRQSGSCPAQC